MLSLWLLRPRPIHGYALLQLLLMQNSRVHTLKILSLMEENETKDFYCYVMHRLI